MQKYESESIAFVLKIRPRSLEYAVLIEEIMRETSAAGAADDASNMQIDPDDMD
jgi:hypothetical protein